MRQHEDGRVIGRLVAPPSLPAAVRSRAADGAEHVSSKDPGADPGKASLRHGIVDAGLSAVLSVHPPPCARLEEPLHELGAADAERILKILVRPGAVAVDGYRKALHAEF